MPNFDGTGPLKRGQIIGRGMGPCKKSNDGCQRKTNANSEPKTEESPSE